MPSIRAGAEVILGVTALKFLCPACERLLDLERFSFEGAALVVTCQLCGATSRAEPAAHPRAAAEGLAASPEAALSAWATAPAPSTPSPTPSAPRVSLVSSPHASNVVTLKTATTEAVQRALASLGAPFEVPAGLCPKCLAPRGPGPACPACGLAFDGFRAAMVEPPGWLRIGWVELLKDWGNDARHQRLRAEASARGALPELGRLYRLRLASMPEDPWAATGREEVLQLAQAAVAANLTNPRPAATSGRRPWLVVGLVLVVVACATALARMLLYPQG